jgi:hypothetical protein
LRDAHTQANDAGETVKLTEEEQARVMLRELGLILKSACPTGWGFTLLMFRMGASGDLLYASNAQRRGMIASLRELIAKLEES